MHAAQVDAGIPGGMLRDVSEYLLSIQPLMSPQQIVVRNPGLGGCRIQDASTTEKRFRPIFPILFVKQRCDWPRTIKRMEAKALSLAAIP